MLILKAFSGKKSLPSTRIRIDVSMGMRGCLRLFESIPLETPPEAIAACRNKDNYWKN